MKIHEKILTHFQCCDSPVDREGYLYKKGERNTSYQKRWFLLKGNLLFYKDRPSDREPLGVVVLEGCSLQLCESDEQFAFSLVWSAPGLRTYKLAAEDQSGQEAWIKALLSANHSYLSLLVMDLEQQYWAAVKAFPSDSHRASSTLPGATLPSPLPPHPGRAALPPPLPLPSCPPTGAGFSSSLSLPAPPRPSKPAVKKSPKLWPKRNANVAPLSGPAPPQGEWSGTSGLNEEFNELHEDFGKEIRELIADWLKRGRRDEEEDLIDLG